MPVSRHFNSPFRGSSGRPGQGLAGSPDVRPVRRPEPLICLATFPYSWIDIVGSSTAREESSRQGRLGRPQPGRAVGDASSSRGRRQVVVKGSERRAPGIAKDGRDNRARRVCADNGVRTMKRRLASSLAVATWASQLRSAFAETPQILRGLKAPEFRSLVEALGALGDGNASSLVSAWASP